MTSSTGIRVLKRICAAAGLSAEEAVPLRLAENQIWQLPRAGVVVRIAQRGQLESTEREVRVARWLAVNGITAVRLADVPQPVEVDGRPATFWEELPVHEHGSPTDVAQLLRQLHSMNPTTDLGLRFLDPFVRLRERVQNAITLDEKDRSWLTGLHDELACAWRDLPVGLPLCAIHGDAWPGNLVRTVDGPPTMLDLERFSIGPPEWDLVSTAVRARTTGAVTAVEYEEFCASYGHDVTQWSGYDLLARTRELRMVTYAAQHAASKSAWAQQARYRLDCLRGRHGPRPWSWTGIM